MFFCKTRHWSDYAQRVKADSLPELSSKYAKDFLKEKSVDTLLDFLNLKSEDFNDLPVKKGFKTKIKNLQERLFRHVSEMNTNGFKPRFSKRIPEPPIKPKNGKIVVLDALLFFERFFGNSRNITVVKNKHLPDIYGQVEIYRKKRLDSRLIILRRLQPTG